MGVGHLPQIMGHVCDLLPKSYGVRIWSVQSNDVIGKDLYCDVIICVSVEQCYW